MNVCLQVEFAWNGNRNKSDWFGMNLIRNFYQGTLYIEILRFYNYYYIRDVLTIKAIMYIQKIIAKNNRYSMRFRYTK